jgi:LmbE family N-acetylglucosaminyl deacetylase
VSAITKLKFAAVLAVAPCLERHFIWVWRSAMLGNIRILLIQLRGVTHRRTLSQNFLLLLTLLITALALTSCALKPTATPPVQFDFSQHLRGKVLLFVAAHPDDEWGLAPMFAEACLFNGAKCHFVVAAEAKSWGCFPTIGLADPTECSRIRRGEMATSARNLRGDLTFFGWEDAFYAFDQAGMQRNIALWAKENGGRDALVAKFKSVMDAVKPDLVLAHDPRHGTTCHPNHRAVTLLMLEALDQMDASQRPEVWFESDFFIDEMMDASTKS